MHIDSSQSSLYLDELGGGGRFGCRVLSGQSSLHRGKLEGGEVKLALASVLQLEWQINVQLKFGNSDLDKANYPHQASVLVHKCCTYMHLKDFRGSSVDGFMNNPD